MSVLGTTVFQVPKLGETGFKIDQLNEAKKKEARAKLDKEVAATGAEQAYMDNAAGLTGIYKQIADAEFQTFRQAAIQYEKTGSASDEAKMQQAAGELKYSVTAGKSILATASEEYVNNKANGFKDVAMSPTEASQLYTGFTNRTGEVVVKNGRVLVKDGDNFVPATQSTYLQSSVNANNSFIMPRVIKQGSFVDTESFMTEVRGAISAGSTAANAQSRVNTLFNEKLKDKNFKADILTAYAISADDGLGMIDDPTKMTADKYAEIQALASNPEIVEQAENWYRQRVMNSVPPRWKATSSGEGSGLSSTTFDITVAEGVTTLTLTGQGAENDKGEPIFEEDGETQKRVGTTAEVENYMGLPSNAQAKGEVTGDGRNKFNIVGLGVDKLTGKLVAERNVYEGDVTDTEALIKGKYEADVVTMTTQMFSKLPARTQKLVKKRLLESGYSEADVKNMIKGESVSLQTQDEESQSTATQQQWDEGLAAAQAAGMSAQDYAELVGDRP